MKFGIRTPSLKKKLLARATGYLTRELKKAIDPTYGKGNGASKVIEKISL